MANWHLEATLAKTRSDYLVVTVPSSHRRGSGGCCVDVRPAPGETRAPLTYWTEYVDNLTPVVA